MIKIDVRLDSAGLLSSIRATGHSGAAAQGYDIICASASVLLRTLARTLESKEGITVTGSADMKGEFFLGIDSFRDNLSDWLNGVTVFGLTGMRDLEAEYPDACTVSINKEMKE